MSNPVFIRQPDGQYLRQEIVQEVELDPEIAAQQLIMDQGEAAIQDYMARIDVVRDQILLAKQRRDAIIASKVVNP